MVQIKNPLSGGGSGGSADIVNGIIEQYKASSGTIDANTFVEFVTSAESFENNKVGVSQTSYYYAAAQIDENRVIFGFGLYVAILTIDNDGSVEVGTVVEIDIRSGNKKIVYLENGVGVIFMSGYLIPLIIEGTTITVGTSLSVFTVGSTTYASFYNGLDSLTSSSIVISYSDSSNGYFYVRTYSISSSGMITALSSNANISANTTRNSSVCALTDGKAAISYVQDPNTNSGTIYGCGVIISGSTITRGTITSVGTSNAGLGVDLCRLGNDFAVGFWCSASSPYLLRKVMFSFPAGDTTLYLREIPLFSLPRATYDRPIFIKNGNSARLYYTVVASDSSAVSVYESMAWVDKIGKDCALAEPVLLHNYSYNMNNKGSVCATILSPNMSVVGWYGLISTSRARVQEMSDISPWFGLTATACSDTTAGDVWVLDTGSGSE